jgi:FixJ family two-component response regulator
VTVDGRKVFVVDDDDAVLRALHRVLSIAGFDVQTFASAESFLSSAPHDGPACVIVDQRMPGTNGLQLQAALEGQQRRGLTVIFLTGYGDVPTTVRAMKAGAFDFLTKPVEDGPLIETVRRALDESERQRMVSRERLVFLGRIQRLTSRERQVCALVIRGLLNKEVAWEMGIAEKTVKIHRAHLMEKLEVRSVAELSRLVERTGALAVLC